MAQNLRTTYYGLVGLESGSGELFDALAYTCLFKNKFQCVQWGRCVWDCNLKLSFRALTGTLLDHINIKQELKSLCFFLITLFES